MNLPFDVTQFFAVFASYNTAVWPAQVALTALAVGAALLARRPRAWSHRTVSGVLALLWVWMGVVYHGVFFSSINPAGPVFAALFVLEGVALGVVGGLAGRLRFRVTPGLRGVAGASLLGYALLAYPLLGYAAGHRYPATPTFGLPCPTTIFTLGMLLGTEPPAPKFLLVIPLAWSAIGVSAAVQLGVWEDVGLAAAGVVTALLTFVPGQGAEQAGSTP